MRMPCGNIIMNLSKQETWYNLGNPLEGDCSNCRNRNEPNDGFHRCQRGYNTADCRPRVLNVNNIVSQKYIKWEWDGKSYQS